MRSVIQRVHEAKIRTGSKLISEIGMGILVYLGIHRGDSKEDAKYLAEKIVNLRIFEDPKEKMNHSLLEVHGGIMIVSQFTLLGDCRKGRRPSFLEAENPSDAKVLYNYFIDIIKENSISVAHGVFQGMMNIESINHGPVTLLLDSRKVF